MDDPIISFVTEKAKTKAWNETYDYLDKLIRKNSVNGGIIFNTVLDHYGKMGVDALRNATPRDTGTTANSWSYRIENNMEGKYRLIFENTNIVKGINIAILIDNGHLTKNGYYIEGYHYIDPTIQPIFDKIANSIWKEIIET